MPRRPTAADRRWRGGPIPCRDPPGVARCASGELTLTVPGRAARSRSPTTSFCSSAFVSWPRRRRVGRCCVASPEAARRRRRGWPGASSTSRGVQHEPVGSRKNEFDLRRRRHQQPRGHAAAARSPGRSSHMWPGLHERDGFERSVLWRSLRVSPKGAVAAPERQKIVCGTESYACAHSVLIPSDLDEEVQNEAIYAHTGLGCGTSSARRRRQEQWRESN